MQDADADSYADEAGVGLWFYSILAKGWSLLWLHLAMYYLLHPSPFLPAIHKFSSKSWFLSKTFKAARHCKRHFLMLQGPVADSIVHVAAILCHSCHKLLHLSDHPQEKPEKEAFVTELRDFETCPDAAHWRLEGPKGWAMLLEITETIDPRCTNPTPCLHTFRF